VRHADIDADLALLKVAHHAAGSVQPEGAAASQQDRVRLLDQVHRAQQVGLAGAGRAAALVDAADRARLADDHGAAGDRVEVLRVADGDPRNVGNGVMARAGHRMPPSSSNQNRRGPLLWRLRLLRSG
jgi:hypothetical protein